MAAALAVVDKVGLEALSLRAVARRARVSAPAVYWHFRDKRALVAAVLAALAARYTEAVEATTGLDGALDAVIDFAVEHPRWYHALFRAPRERARKPLRESDGGGTLGLLVVRVGEAMAAGRLRPGDAVSVALTFAALVQGLVVLAERGRFASREELRAFCRCSLQRLEEGLK